MPPFGCLFRPFAIMPALLVMHLLPLTGVAQDRVTPKESRGGKPLQELWADIPEEFRQLKFPDWRLPADLKLWRDRERKATLEQVLRCLGELPPRPASPKVTVTDREDRGDYLLECIEFHNGVDALVPGILLIPTKRSRPFPAIVGLHGHGGSSETICTDEKNPQGVGPMLARKGFLVAAIDSYFCGARVQEQDEAPWPG